MSVPTEITPDKRFTLTGAVLIGLLVLAVGWGISWADIKATKEELPPVKARLETIEREAHDSSRKLDVIANDVTWIKQELLRRRLPSPAQ